MSDESDFSPAQVAAAPPPGAVVDEIPGHFFGNLTTDFYAGVGRMTALTALLEDRLRALLQAVDRVPQTEYGNKSISGLVTAMEERAPALGSDWEAFGTFARRIRTVNDLRNNLVHNLWQPKPDGTFFGHRDSRSGERVSTTISLEDVDAAVSELVTLYGEWRYWYDRAGALPVRPGQA